MNRVSCEKETKMKLNLYRGIYTDAEHAELIRRQGIDEKWYIDTEKLRVNHDNIDEFLSRDSLQREDVVIPDESSRIIFGCGTYRDACYYAYRNATQGGYAITAKERASEQFSGPKEMFVFSFQVPEEDVFIDANDFLYPICYFPERIKGPRKKQLCKVFGEEIIDKYLPLLMNELFNRTQLANLITMERSAIRNLYDNKEILLVGKKNVSVYSSFKTTYKVTAEDILSVEKITEEECQKVLGQGPKAVCMI
ncbi:MAG: hypothetical protein K5897_01075 [Eubacterium sp.]|nr:hypothetical protein [Eubacterium sp.]